MFKIRVDKMKVYKKEINGLKMTAYNDSGADWVILCNGNEYRYTQTMTLKRAFEMHAELYGIGGPFEGM